MAQRGLPKAKIGVQFPASAFSKDFKNVKYTNDSKVYIVALVNYSMIKGDKISKEKLEVLYEKEKFSYIQLAKYFSCSKNTIAYWLRKYDIKTRTPSQSMKLFSGKKGKISKEELYRLFIDEKLTPEEIAKKYNYKFNTIVNKLGKHKILNKFSKGKMVEISKSELKRLYLNKKLTSYDIAQKFGCCQASVWKKLKQYDIKRRDSNSSCYFNIPSKRLLERLYVKERLSTWEIEKRYGFSRSTVHRHLKKYGIIMNRAESHIKYPRKDFDGNALKKAYLIGFRIGDLRVRKNWENGNTLQIDCGSTKLSQIKLIKKLFEPYAHVWTSRPNKNGKFQIQVHANLSFSFLLNKSVPGWVFKNKETFFSFFSGFTDAEGSIGIGKRKLAFYSLGNYDSELLNRIRNQLIRYNLPCNKLSISYRRGRKIFEKYYCNHDYYGLMITKKDTLLKLITLIKPYLKHEDKIHNLMLAETNILDRDEKYGK